ncbi:MAG: protein translocase subunit SecD [Firmicutes bacterium]|nr:protein translocase subunit SecD [Bacillota bacterium]
MKGKSTLTLTAILVVMAGLIAVIVFGIGTERHLSIVNIRQGLDLQGGVSILYEADIHNPSSADMAAANDLLRNRLDSRGYTEATTAQEGARQIRVDIPGVADAEAAVAQIGATAMLTFTDQAGNVLLTGAHVSRANAGVQATAHGVPEVVVNLEFTSEGTRLFADATRNNIGRPIMIWMDDEMISSPIVNSAITDGTAVISGHFTNETANLLATQIRQGSLPFGLNVISMNLVGARLGADALRTSVIAGIIGVILLLIFLLAVYRTLGIAADLALILDGTLFLLIISGLGITMSLPGIAGLILSIGMATDANIVIFERIREEVASGKTLRAAMRTGYRRALPAILDSNITTLIAGVVLFQLGTGPIMGFAQMLIIGILLSMFTSLLVGRIAVSCLINMNIIKPAHILNQKQKDALEAANGREVEPDTSEYPIVQNRKKYLAFSAAVIAIGLTFAVVNQINGNGFFDLDVEFSGGTSFTIDIGQPFQNSEIESIVRDITGESAPQVQAILGTNEVLIRTTQVDPAVRIALVQAFTERFNLDNEAFTYSDVSPAVSAAMRRDAMVAIVIATIGMLLYITLRFRDVRKGASAVFAQLHDAVVVLCVYMIFRVPLNYAFIAVMLTTIGYSINATIIIFDRIRENRVRLPKTGNDSLINVSVTQTLRRTLFSTLSSFMVVLVLWIIGVPAIREFTLPIMVGLLFGAYSSVCLSGSAWYMMLKEKKEQA